ncbi:unnamed protein product [Protopolystoma xenopodis]|uniref:Golgi to ER traffic protein 4 homolog n=1 Tax=Protopolystoma xenopodis TaxID=117903 RepID=A0A3S5BQZ4_9PLAT|nr:unnamed protein product [Protopolystoma xenopodis]
MPTFLAIASLTPLCSAPGSLFLYGFATYNRMALADNRPSKLQQRLDNAVSEFRFYEVHQLHKTIYFRYITRRNYSEALKSILSGAIFLLDNEQWESGIDLSCLVLEVYTKSGIELGESHLNQLCELLRRMTSPSDERDTFISKTLQLLRPNRDLFSVFNEYLGRKLWQEGMFEEARTRIMMAANGYVAGRFLIELHQRCGFRSELDLFIAQAVLQFLCMKKTSVAALTFYTYTRGHPRLEPGPPFTRFPLLNFLWFLMLAIERKCTLSVFSVLCDKYSLQIDRDPTYVKYLEKISQLYFGVKPKSERIDGFLSRFVKLLTGPDEEEGEVSVMDQSIPSKSQSTSKSMNVEDID